MEIVIGILILLAISFLWAYYSLRKEIGKKRRVLTNHDSSIGMEGKEIVLFDRQSRKN